MASQAQIDANRLNAQKSTGPVTDDGKAKTRFNAVKHGAYALEAGITGQDPEKFAERERRYVEFFNPLNPDEEFHVRVLIAAENEIDRCVFLECSTLKSLIDQQPETSENPFGDACLQDSQGSNAIGKIAQRRNAACHRWLRSRKVLQQLLEQRQMAEAFMDQPIATPAAPPPAPKPAAAAPAPKPVVVPVPPANAATQQHAQPKPQKGGFTGNEPAAWRL